MDKRLQQLHQWIAEKLELSDYELQPASADASFRRYFRLNSGESSNEASGENTRIIMDAPPDREDSRPFVDIARRLVRIGLNAPVILNEDLEQGFLVLSDLGDTTYLSVLKESNADRLYRSAMDALIVLQTQFENAAGLPHYDQILLRQEMTLFPDWYIERHLRHELDEEERRILGETFSFLESSALSQPAVAVHRDYHSRNLMVCTPNPGILDFQDAVYGPITYDLVSLLRDCYIRWPVDQQHQWMEYYWRKARHAGLEVGDMEAFRREYDFMGVQRHLKAIGIFARLNYRDGKPNYLEDIPRTLDYVLEVCAHYQELTAFGEFLDATVVPHLRDEQRGRGSL